MKRKLLSTILIMVMLLTSVVMAPEEVFAEPETTTYDGQTESSYLTFEVKAPKGSKVQVESITYNGQGYIDDASGKNVGVFGPEIFEAGKTFNGDKAGEPVGIENFFKFDPRSYLDVGNYYYKITQKDLGVKDVEYDKSEYLVWVYIDYLTDDAGNYLDEDGNIVPDSSTAAKRLSIVLQKDDETEKPLGIEFKNCKKETIEIKRTITYTRWTEDGKKVQEDVVETVTLTRKVICDAEGNPIKKDGTPAGKGEEVIIGSNGNPIAYDENGKPVLADESGNPIKDASGKTQPVTKWQIESISPTSSSADPINVNNNTGKATVTKPVTSPNCPDDPDDPKWKNWKTDRPVVEGWEIDLNDPKDAIEHVVYKPTMATKEEKITVKRTITYTERTVDGKKVYEPVVQEVTLVRTILTDAEGNPIKLDGTPATTEDEKVIIGSNGNPIGKDPETGEYVLCDEDGNPVKDANGKTQTTTKWRIDSGDTSAKTTKDHPKKDSEGWKPDRDVVDKWEIDLNDPKDAIEHVVYMPEEKPEPKPTEEYEYRTFTRIITYTEYTPDGKEVSKTVIQTVTIKRKITTNPDGTQEIGKWEIIDGDTSSKKSPDHAKKNEEGWKPDIDEVGEWEIDLENPPKDGYQEIVHVVYTPDKKPEPEPGPTEEYEYRTFTRIITYTEYTPDGKEVSKTAVQTLTIRRKITTNPDGTQEIGEWEIASGDKGAVKSPTKLGWTRDIDEVGEWNIDLNNPPEDGYKEIVHVIYTPKSIIKTGDENNLILWGGLAGGAALIIILLFILKKRGKKEE
ncbi:MAG: LPXTG cell wall anchor domain-containing protein [Firmicutes bacterium]|nr:LPXTG cell wall anchor domain-containing protein [Bacillota bacterium]